LGIKILLEIRSAQAGLTDDGQECPYQDFFMIGHGNRFGSFSLFPLHNNMAASTPDFDKPMPRKYRADFFSG
jgi:hypothetical protein